MQIENIEKYYYKPLYCNSVTMMLNFAFAAFFGLLFRIVAARTRFSKRAWGRSEVKWLGLMRGNEAGS